MWSRGDAFAKSPYQGSSSPVAAVRSVSWPVPAFNGTLVLDALESFHSDPPFIRIVSSWYLGYGSIFRYDGLPEGLLKSTLKTYPILALPDGHSLSSASRRHMDEWAVSGRQYLIAFPLDSETFVGVAWNERARGASSRRSPGHLGATSSIAAERLESRPRTSSPLSMDPAGFSTRAACA